MTKHYEYKVAYETNDNYRERIIRTKKAVNNWKLVVEEMGGSILYIKKVIVINE